MALIFAHRGFSDRYPENTMLSFQKAIEAGCDGIELDVQLSKDGEPVIIHDERLKRTTRAPGYVWEYTLAELKRLDASGKYHRLYGKNGIPTLREYFALTADRTVITNIELKTEVNTYPGIEKKVLELLDEYKLRNRVIVSSFHPDSLIRFRKLAPDVSCGLLEGDKTVGMAKYAKKLGMDFLNLRHELVSEACVREAEAYGIRINAWTVNKKEEIQRLKRLRVYGLIGNNPEAMKKI